MRDYDYDYDYDYEGCMNQRFTLKHFQYCLQILYELDWGIDTCGQGKDWDKHA